MGNQRSCDIFTVYKFYLWYVDYHMLFKPKITYLSLCILQEHPREMHGALWYQYQPLLRGHKDFGTGRWEDLITFFAFFRTWSSFCICSFYLQSFYIWMWLGIIFNLTVFFLTSWKFWNRSFSARNDVLVRTCRKLLFYPFILVVSWIINTVTDCMYTITKTAPASHANLIYIIGNAVACLQVSI